VVNFARFCLNLNYFDLPAANFDCTNFNFPSIDPAQFITQIFKLSTCQIVTKGNQHVQSLLLRRLHLFRLPNLLDSNLKCKVLL
jgi:hypothetical protein